MEPVLQTYIVKVEIPVSDTVTFEFEVQASSPQQAESFVRATLKSRVNASPEEPDVVEGDYEYDDAEFTATLDEPEDDEL